MSTTWAGSSRSSQRAFLRIAARFLRSRAHPVRPLHSKRHRQGLLVAGDDGYGRTEAQDLLHAPALPDRIDAPAPQKASFLADLPALDELPRKPRRRTVRAGEGGATGRRPRPTGSSRQALMPARASSKCSAARSITCSSSRDETRTLLPWTTSGR